MGYAVRKQSMKVRSDVQSVEDKIKEYDDLSLIVGVLFNKIGLLFKKL